MRDDGQHPLDDAREKAKDRLRTLSIDRTVESYTLSFCKDCGHGPDDHRPDDGSNVSPTDPLAKFRCVGHQNPVTERWIDTDCACPDYWPTWKDVRRVATDAR